jgi:hypothetical protein
MVRPPAVFCPSCRRSEPLTHPRRAYVKQDGSFDLSAEPPFNLSDIRAAIPAHCFERSPVKSMAYLAADVAIVLGLAVGAYTLNNP